MRKGNCIYNCKLNLYTTDCQDEVLVMRAHGSLHMHQCSYNSQGYTGRATHLFNLPSHPGSLHSDPTGVQVGHDQAKTLTGDVTHRATARWLIRAHHNKSRDSRSRQLLRFRNRTRPAEKAEETMMAAVLAMAKERSTITITILSS